MSTAITTEIARIDEMEHAEAPTKEEVNHAAESVKTQAQMDAEALEADAETAPSTEKEAGADAAESDLTEAAANTPDQTDVEALNESVSDEAAATIPEEISVTDSSKSIMPDEDLVPPQTEPTLPDEDTSVVDPAHALILDDEAVAKSAESVFLDDASVTNFTEPSIADSATETWQSLQSNTKTFFENAGSYTTAFFKNNRQLLTTLGVIFLVIISAKLLFAGLDAIDDIPLVAPILKITGLVYLVRFVWRYLIRERDRRELVEKIEHTKAEVLGN
jgi:hypothetical protein